MTLLFATNNLHKVEEVKAVVPSVFSILPLKEAGIDLDIPEPYDTLDDNARIKARTIYTLTNCSCFSEDSGLEVEELNGEPGVKSARYAGETKDPNKNIEKLLSALQNATTRQARFRTVFCLILNGQEWLFEGICNGRISLLPKGKGGFGYDSVFIPDGTSRTFAQMTLAEKNNYSHRRKAMDKLVTFLKQYNINQ